MPDTPRVTNNTAAGQFEIRTADGVALLTYAIDGDTIDLVHTRVPKQMEGKGDGAALANAALEYARAQHMKVIPTCPFVRSYLRRHPEYSDLIKT